MATQNSTLNTQSFQIALQQVGKRFRFDWIFKNLSHQFTLGNNCAILGANGSGKSTLMKVLAGHSTPTKGKIIFTKNNAVIAPDEVYKNVSYAAPYIDLIEEFSLKESLQFHQRFQPLQAGLTTTDLIDILQFSKSKNKEVRFFSSGMKQRLKLVLACCSDTPLLLLDEPTTNLDEQGMNWYLELIEKFAQHRLVIVASNVPIDYQFCAQKIDIQEYK